MRCSRRTTKAASNSFRVIEARRLRSSAAASFGIGWRTKYWGGGSLGIADLAKDGGTTRSRGRWNVRRQMTPGLISQEREGYCFLGRGRHAKVVGGANLYFQRREFFADHAHQRRILSSAARNDKLRDSVRAIGNWAACFVHPWATQYRGRRLQSSGQSARLRWR